MGEQTSYDAVEYPAATYPSTHPAHLAALARLHGLSAPDPRTCRVLEIAGGDGLNLAGMAAGLPDAHFTSFDLSREAVARGQALVEKAGLGNVEVLVGDLLDWADNASGSYDYVIAHGLYAWVPEVVRAAMWRLIDRVLSPEGVAFVSYNALPGGYLRMAVRDTIRHAAQGLTGEARIAKAREVLRAFSAPRENERIVLQALRKVAEPMLAKNDGSLFHDELGEEYAPQSLTQVVEAAGRHNLAFLNDAVPKMVGDGLPGQELDDAAVVAAAQASDYEAAAFFHQSLFVRPGRNPSRILDATAFAELVASARLERTGPTGFTHDEGPFEISDVALADFLEALGKAWPLRLPLAQFAASPDHCEALLDLFRNGIVAFHALPYPGTVTPGERPEASPLVRGQVALGMPILFSLDLKVVTMQRGPRHFLSLLDGTRDRARLERDWAASEYGGQIPASAAVEQMAQAALMLR